MKTISFQLNYVGMNDETYSEFIAICKPRYSLSINLNEEEYIGNGICTIGNLITYVRDNIPCIDSFLNEIEFESLTYSSVYCRCNDYLLSTTEDRLLDDLFTYFHTEHLDFVYFYVGGGASEYCDGYTFTVHSNEQIHKNSPHVHVERDGYSVRYSLETLKRYPKDKCGRIYDRDERKIIQPALKELQGILLEYWYHAVNGYKAPTLDENRRQYYPET